MYASLRLRCSGPRRHLTAAGEPGEALTAPIRERVPRPVGDGRDILGRQGAEQDEEQVTATGAMRSAEVRQAEDGLIPGATAMPAGSADLPGLAGAHGPLAADALYDARRGVYYTKPVLRGWLHLVWFEISVVIGTLLLARAHGATRITAAAIYAASVSALFGVSALYHRGNWTAAWRRRLQRLDHAMIFFLIAGTATPAFLLANRGPFGLVCLIVMWTLTLTAAAVHMAWMSAPEVVVGGTFVGLGWVRPAWRCRGYRSRPVSRRQRWCSLAACSTRPGRFLIAVGPTRTRRCSATTRSSTRTSAPPRRASSLR